MAGGGEGEEENYWPGYVDALTTMTMVLTFIMMILGVVIFSMSQNVSKILVQQIAEAAKVELKGGGSVEQMRDQVIAAIQSSKKTEKIEKEQVKDGQEVVDHPMRGDSYAMPAPSSNPSAKTKLAAPAQPESDDEGKLAGKFSSAEPLIDAHEKKQAASPPSPVGEDPNKVQPDRRIEAPNNNVHADKSAGVALSSSGSVLTIQFAKRVAQLDDTATQAMKEMVSKSDVMRSAKIFEIKGYADVSALGVSEARRVAYYRAMLVRRQMMAVGYEADHLVVKIEDAAATDSDLVRIFAR